MAVTVPATDIVNNLLQAQITSVQALVNANANPADLFANTQLLWQLQMQLVMNLMGNTNSRGNPGAFTGLGTLSFLNPATILSSLSINT
jgi:hypothetical protein